MENGEAETMFFHRSQNQQAVCVCIVVMGVGVGLPVLKKQNVLAHRHPSG